jgi:hypothetical protein
MTRQPHDQFAKQYLEKLLSPLGKVEVSREVTDEVRQVDILFFPVPSPNTNPQSLGLLGKIATIAWSEVKELKPRTTTLVKEELFTTS